MTSSTLDRLPAAELAPVHVPSSGIARVRGLVAERLVARKHRRELERAVATVGGHEWARMESDFRSV